MAVDSVSVGRGEHCEEEAETYIVDDHLQNNGDYHDDGDHHS